MNRLFTERDVIALVNAATSELPGEELDLDVLIAEAHRAGHGSMNFAAPRSGPVEPGDEVWVRAVVTGVRDGRVRVGVRVASRVGSSYPGSSTKSTRVIDGVVRRIAEVPSEDVQAIPRWPDPEV